jgi:hypothetical protein
MYKKSCRTRRPAYALLTSLTAAALPYLILMTASHLSSTQVQASLQKDAIPFGFNLGLSLITLVPAGSRLWGCTRVPNLSRWHLLVCCLSLAGSVSLFVIVVSKVYERHHDPYLGLILTNVVVLALYEVCIANRMVLLLLSFIRLRTSGQSLPGRESLNKFVFGYQSV